MAVVADRTVVIRLLAKVDEYKAAMKSAATATDQVGKSTQETAKKSQSALGSLAKHARDNEQAWKEVGAGFLGVGIAAGAGLAAASVSFASFDRQMSAVQAATLATASEMDGLRDAAVKAGADTAFSANEAAQGIEELAKAGISTRDIIGGGLTGALDLAAAGGLDVGRAAEIAATAVTQFGLSGEDVVGVADALAAGANKAQGSVEDLGLALSYAGVPANALGISVEETAGVLGLFANAGIIGEKAGTALRAMLVSLQNPSEKASGLMEDLGVEVFDAQGKFIGMEATAQVLQDRLGGLTDQQRGAALATIFGNESLGAATTLYNGGSAAVASWTEAVSESGYAAEVAATRLDNLYGDVEALGGSLESAMIGLGESSNGPLRELTQDLTTVVNVFGDMPEGAKNAAVGVGIATAAVGLLGGAALIGTPKVVAFYGAVQQLGPAGQKAAAGMRAIGASAGPIGLVLTAASIAGGMLLDSWIDQKQAVDDYAGSLDELTGAVTDASRAVASKALEDRGALEAAERLGVSTSDLVTAITEGGDAYDRVSAKIAAASEANRDLNDAQMATSGMNNRTEADLEALRDALGGEIAALEESQEVTRRKAEATALSGEAAQKARVALFGLNTELGASSVLAPQVTDGIAPMNEGIAATAEQSEEATKKIQEWRDTLAGVASAFSEPLSTYTEMLAAKEAAEQESAQATADATESSEDSWADYVSGVTLSLEEYSAQLEQQNADQQAWADNLVIIAGRGREGVAAELAAMGPEGAALVAQMASATDEEFNRAADAMIADMRFGGDESIAVLDEKMKVLEAVGRAGAGATVTGIADELALGTDRVREIAAQYGLRLAEGINPILSSLGKENVRPFLPGGGGAAEWRPFADGGFEDHTAQIAPAGAWRVWAEPETGGEAYIPLAPAKRKRSLSIWREAGKRLGVDASFESYASGGFSSLADVPGTPSTAPYRAPISTAGNATTQKAYDEVAAFIKANSFGGMVIPGGAKDLVGIGRMLQSLGARVSEHPAFGGVNGRHSPTSLHYLGRAIDVNYGPGGANATENAFMRQVIPQLREMASFRQLYYREIGGRTDHDDHLHLGMAKGGILNPHVRDQGGPLLPGFTYNGTGGPETVVSPAAHATSSWSGGDGVTNHWHLSADMAAIGAVGDQLVRTAMREAQVQVAARMSVLS